MVRLTWQPVSWLYLGLSFLLLVVCALIMAVLWYGLLRTMGGRLPFAQAIRLYGLTLLPRYVPGMVWGYAGRAIWCEQYGVPKKVAVGSATVEVGLVVVGGLAIVALKHLAWAWIFTFGVPILLLASGLILARITRRRTMLAGFKQGFVWYGWALAYLGFWLMYGLSSWLVTLSVAPQLGVDYASEIVASYAMAWLVGFAAVFVPSGLGVREGVFALALIPVLGHAGAIFVPLLARAVAMLSEFTFFVLCYLGGKLVIAHVSLPAPSLRLRSGQASAQTRPPGTAA
jgi:hypothetical protein